MVEFEESAMMDIPIPPTTSDQIRSSSSMSSSSRPIFETNSSRSPTRLSYHSTDVADISSPAETTQYMEAMTVSSAALMSAQSVDSANRIFLPNEFPPTAAMGLTSPSDIISENAVQQTMVQLIESSKNDTGIGPGRIRKYANEGTPFTLKTILDIDYEFYSSFIEPRSDAWRKHKKHFFILSSAGKPIYSRYGDENQLSSFTGVIQAIISFYQDNDDVIRYSQWR
jgi:hypothetical protein